MDDGLTLEERFEDLEDMLGDPFEAAAQLGLAARETPLASVTVFTSDAGGRWLHDGVRLAAESGWSDWIDELSDDDLDMIAGDLGEGSLPERPAPAWHATSPQASEAILAQGLRARSETRSPSNQHVGAAVFASADRSDLDDGAYGEEILVIDWPAMAAAGLAPHVTMEPGAKRSLQRQAIAAALGLDGYDPGGWHEGVRDSTVIFHGDIPAQFIARA